MIFNKKEKIIQIRATAKRVAHKRRIHFEGKEKESIQFKNLDVTGIEKIDNRISHTIFEFDKRVESGEDHLDIIKSMADSKEKIQFENVNDDAGIKVIMNNLSKIVADSNKVDDDLAIEIIDGERSWFMPNENMIRIGEDGQFSGNIYHENGHHIEANKPVVHRACIKFLENRTKGEDAVKLDELFPNIGYRDDEECKIDKFIHPYMGHLYEQGDATEVLSCGLEKFINSKSIQKFHNQDHDHFALVLTSVLGRL